jgi:hypothetical protein
MEQPVSSAPAGYVDVDFKIPFNFVLAASQEEPNLARDVPTDADFIWRATLYTSFDSTAVRFADSQGYYFSPSRIRGGNLTASANYASLNAKEIVIPAGGQIGVDIENLTAEENEVTIIFLGVKRYKLAGGEKLYA